ncbi:NAD-dependent epimerase/dehydratase family protein [Phormidesmis priestleyi]|uniref:NAD-dependent epimerase/dehydratase family protein n=1 Tax=Phormidesmis priestleyi TaxID=268141 RepID=UPI00083B53B5|nr:NAD(P)-dependent oxidoreductase [Phormidesmis priestleyi]
MTKKRILVTGASGCIGHYIAEALIQETEHELFLLVRNPDKLKLNVRARPGVTVICADMRDIGQHSSLLKTINCAVLTVAAWGGDDVYDINVAKTLELMSLLDPDVCDRVIYFCTASVLGRDNQPLKEAGEIGSDYIRSKYICYSRLSELAIAPKITTVFPTLVLGGGDGYPLSHISSGIADVVKWIKLIRFLDAEGSFHFVHGRDIAQVVRHLVEHSAGESEPRDLVLGNEKITVNQTIEETCDYLNQKIYFRIPLSLWLADLFIFLFRIQMGDWDRFSLHYLHFTYQNAVSPATFGLPTYCATLYDVLKISGIPRRQPRRSKIREPE